VAKNSSIALLQILQEMRMTTDATTFLSFPISSATFFHQSSTEASLPPKEPWEHHWFHHYIGSLCKLFWRIYICKEDAPPILALGCIGIGAISIVWAPFLSISFVQILFCITNQANNLHFGGAQTFHSKAKVDLTWPSNCILYAEQAEYLASLVNVQQIVSTTPWSSWMCDQIP
jgi:hypothetical protein